MPSETEIDTRKKLLSIFPPLCRFSLDTCDAGIYTFFNCNNDCRDGTKFVKRENRQMATKKAAKKEPVKKAAKKVAKKK
jgi:hypothetical protein